MLLSYIPKQLQKSVLGNAKAVENPIFEVVWVYIGVPFVVYLLLPTIFIIQMWLSHTMSLGKWLIETTLFGLYIFDLFLTGIWPLAYGYLLHYILLIVFIAIAVKSFFNVERAFYFKTPQLKQLPLNLVYLCVICFFTTRITLAFIGDLATI